MLSESFLCLDFYSIAAQSLFVNGNGGLYTIPSL